MDVPYGFTDLENTWGFWESTLHETYAASASNVSGSARSWPSVEQIDDPGLPQAQKMNNHEVPSYFDFLANNTSKELHSGSIPFEKNLVCWQLTNLKGFIAKQVQCQSGLFLKHEASVKTLLFDIKMMVSPMQIDSPFCCANTTVTVRQS